MIFQNSLVGCTALEASMEFFGGSEDSERLQECICLTKQLDFMYSLRRMIYDLGIIFYQNKIDDEEE